ncbi:MAG: hypothetical protein AB7N71_08855 [Phycisphaerae bacterium]
MRRIHSRVAAISGVLLSGLMLVGCVSVKAPERVVVNGGSGSRPVDTSRVPPTSSHEDARRKLAEAYQRIDYLEDQLADEKRDNDELERKLDRMEDRNDD